MILFLRNCRGPHYFFWWIGGIFVTAVLCIITSAVAVPSGRLMLNSGWSLPVYRSQLDGQIVSSTAEIIPQVLGIMIDNHPNARPQAGLEQASIVYEVPVEGSFTRYMALFPFSAGVGKVGPVRSARPYFIDWLSEYGDAYYLHSGGSPQALQRLKNGEDGLRDVNEFRFGSFFARDYQRYAPHNLYTPSESWAALGAHFSSAMINWLPTLFVTDTMPLDGDRASSVAFSYATDYALEWRYVPDLGTYQRFVNGRPYLAASGEQLAATTIVIQFVDVEIIDGEGRKAITTIGSGKAFVVRGGRVIRGTWQKNTLHERTRWFDPRGAEIPLVPGPIWIEVVNAAQAVELTN